MKKILLILLIIVLIIALIAILVKILLRVRHTKDVETLFSQSGSISAKTYRSSELKDLPAPVQRYFNHVLKDGDPYISYVTLKHGGYFKTAPENDWVDITGEQYFTAENPGFIWTGKTALFTAEDKYIENKGSLRVWLLSLLRIVNSHGEKIDQGELLRWLGESVWFPTNLLPSDKLQWLPINDSSAKLVYKHNDREVFYIVTFNDEDEIVQMQTERYMNDDLETWVGKLKKYQKINGVHIPTEIEALWKLDKGDYPYVRFKINEIEYDKPVGY